MLSRARTGATLLGVGARIARVPASAPVVAHQAVRRPCSSEGASLRVSCDRALSIAPKAAPKNKFSPRDLALMFGIGSSVGAFGSLVGVGGGIFIVPLLTGVMRMSQLQAQATSLVTYSMSGAVDPVLAGTIAFTAMATTRLGISVAQRMHPPNLKRLMGAFILSVSPLVPLKTYLLQSKAGDKAGDKAVAEVGPSEPAGVPSADQLRSQHKVLFTDATRRDTAVAVGIGAVAGFASGLFGVGGGLLVTPALALLLDVPQQLVLGTTLAAMVPPSLVGVFVHYRLGNLVLSAVPVLVGGSTVGAYLGSKFALGLPEEYLKWLFTVAVGFMGFRMIRV